jgi:hypothetical protein
MERPRLPTAKPSTNVPAMPASRRAPLAVLAAAALVLALASAGCGSSKHGSTTAKTTTASAATTLDAATYERLSRGVNVLTVSMNGLAKVAKACATMAADGEQALRGCLADALGAAAGDLDTLAGTMDDDATKVEGPCSTHLTAFAGELRTVVKTFAGGAKEIRSGDVEKGASVVQHLETAELSLAGHAAQTACRPTEG